MLRPKVSLIFAVLLLIFCTHSQAKLPLEAVLKTSLPEDPYANDGVSFRVLCYHDARDHLLESFQTWPERGALQTSTLIEHFEWLRENGYHMVSMDAIVAARHGGAKLPPKAVLLTFDDGYLSVYTRVFPLLKLFNYPAVIGLVGEWLQETKDGKVFYGDRWMSRQNFVQWSQVREMVASGLVEVASHSHSLHKGVISNPQGSLPSSAITRLYNPKLHHYETDDEFMARLRADLARNNALITREIGQSPRVMIWPYGAYNMLGVKAAEAEGMPITMTLDPGANTPDFSLNRMRREMLMFNDKVTELKRNLLRQVQYDGHEQPLSRIVAIDLDSLYDPDPAKQEKKLGELIERLHELRINTVYLRVLSDSDHNGLVDSAYFPNRHLPLRVDLFNRVAWQLNTRAGVQDDTIYVYAWMPTSGYEIKGNNALSQKVIDEIFDDMAKNAPRIAGLLLGDEADAVDIKDKSTDGFHRHLIARFKIHQPTTFVARYVPIKQWLKIKQTEQAPIMVKLLNQFDFVTFGVLTPSDNQAVKGLNLEAVMDNLAFVPRGLDGSTFLLQLTDSSKGGSAFGQTMTEQMQLLQQHGARNFGIYSNQLSQDSALFSQIKKVLSLHVNPGHSL